MWSGYQVSVDATICGLLNFFPIITSRASGVRSYWFFKEEKHIATVTMKVFFFLKKGRENFDNISFLNKEESIP